MRYRDLRETALDVGEASGLSVASHPLARGILSLGELSIRSTLQDLDVARILVGVETFNGGPFSERSDKEAVPLAEDLGLASAGCSDSHLLATLGSGKTAYNGHSRLDLRRALERRETRAIARPMPTSFKLV